jgi:hypothetical protein
LLYRRLRKEEPQEKWMLLCIQKNKKTCASSIYYDLAFQNRRYTSDRTVSSCPLALFDPKTPMMHTEVFSPQISSKLEAVRRGTLFSSD